MTAAPPDLSPAAVTRAEIVAALRAIYLPRCRLNAWEWCEANIVLDPEESRDNHGPYSTAETPYVRRIFEFLSRPDEHELIIRKSAQLGITLAYMLIMCYVAATQPTHAFYAMHSAKKAREISGRLRRLFTRNAALATTLLPNVEETLLNLSLSLRGMDITLTGSGSAGEFGASSFGLVILDELDRHEKAPNQQANTIDLARDRVKQVASAKLIAGGTPVQWDDETQQNFLTGTREELHVRCPHCGTEQPLRWEQMRFEHCKDERGQWDYALLLRDTYYACVTPGCADEPIRRWREADKRRLFAPTATRWVAGNTGADDHKPFPGRASLWINDLYSLREQTTWGHLAAKWVDAQRSPSKLRSFFNETLGLPQRERRSSFAKTDIHSLCAGYDHGCMPVAPALAHTYDDDGNITATTAAIFLCADVQATEKKWVKVGFTFAGDAYLIDYGRTLDFATLLIHADEPVFIAARHPGREHLEALRAAAEAAGRGYFAALAEAYPDTPVYTASTGLIDEGHDTFRVRSFCTSTADPYTGLLRLYPSKGVARVTVRSLVEEVAGKFQDNEGQIVTVYHYADDHLKSELYIGRIGGHAARAAGKSEQPTLYLPAHPEPDLVAELCAERREQVLHRGALAWRWADPKTANDFGDAVKMAMACWHVTQTNFAA